MLMRSLRRAWSRWRGYDPAMNNSTIQVNHRSQGQCFEAIVDGQRCVADYQRHGDVVRLTHTFVPPALEGRGIAGQLIHAALTWADAEKLKVDPQCSYAAMYVQRHPEWRRLVA